VAGACEAIANGPQLRACCGGALHPIGESVSEVLDWVPAKFRIIRICRPKFGCRACGTVSQAPAPEPRSQVAWRTPALLTQALVSKYCDHTPLNRWPQSYLVSRDANAARGLSEA
jgi:transposase